jgi:hypothetical protein
MAEFNVGAITATITLDNTGFLAGVRTAGSTVKTIGKAITATFKAIARVGKASFKALTLPMRTFVKALKKVKSAIGNVVAKLNPMRMALGALAGGFALLKLAQQAEQATQAAVAFRQLSLTLGTTAPEALRIFRDAMRGTVSDMAIMTQVSNAAILGVGSNIEEMAEIFRIARRLGQATGRSSEEALTDIVVGIGRQSRLILDNLGLIVQVTKANEAYASKLGILVEELTDSDKRVAFLTATLDGGRHALGKLGDEVDTFALKFQQIGSSFSNFFTNLSVRVAPAMGSFIGSLQQLNAIPLQDSIAFSLGSALESISNWITEHAPGINKFFEDLGIALVVVKTAIEEVVSSTGDNLISLLTHPERIGAFFGNLVKSHLTIWLGVGQLIGGAFMKVFVDNRAVIFALFKSAGNQFLKALAPIGSIFEEVFDRFDDVLIRLHLKDPEKELKTAKRELSDFEGSEELLYRLVVEDRAGTIAGSQIQLMKDLEKTQEARLSEIAKLSKFIDREERRVGELQERLTEQANDGITEADVLLDGGLKNIQEGVDGIFANVTGLTVEELEKRITEVVEEFDKQMELERKKIKDGTEHGFEPLDANDRLQAEMTVGQVGGLDAEGIADAFLNDRLKSMSEVLNAANTLMAEHKRISKDVNALYTDRLESIEMAITLQGVVDSVTLAQSIAQKKSKIFDERKIEATKELEELEKARLEILNKIEDTEAANVALGLEGAEQRIQEEDNILAALRRQLDEYDGHIEAKQTIIDLAGQQLDLERFGTVEQLRIDLEERIKKIRQESASIGLVGSELRRMAEEEYLGVLEKQLETLGADAGKRNEILDLARQLIALEDGKIGNEEYRTKSIEFEQQIKEAREDLALVGLTDDARRLIAQDNFLESLAQELSVSGMLVLEQDAILAAARKLFDLKNKTVEKTKEELRLTRVSDTMGSSLIEAAKTGEDAFKLFTKSFTGDFEMSVTKAVSNIADSMGSLFGEGMKKFVGSEGFGAIMGFIGFLSQRENTANITEIPTEEIIASSTTVRGVVAGPENVAISQIGSSIREANRGVESLLTEIRDTLQSIEDSGLTSGGLGPAALT